HVFLQAGVGSFAGAIVASFKALYGEQAPKFILVEPHQANCYYESFVAKDHSYRTVGGALDTIMAGLSCGEPNPRAWEILKNEIDLSISADDRVAALGMRLLSSPLGEDERVIAGESGALPAGVLYVLMTDNRYKELRDRLDIGERSKVVLINTEGDTDEKHYKEV